VVDRSKGGNIFARLNTEIVGSNSTPDMDVSLRFFCVCVVLCRQRTCDRADPQSEESCQLSIRLIISE
jgi:hypothetical protein